MALEYNTSCQYPVRRISGEWFILAAAILWGTTGTAQALAPPNAQPAAIGAVRLVIGGGALLLVALARRSFRPGERWSPLELIFASGGIAAYQLFFFAGIYRTGVAAGTMVAIGSSPIFAGLLGFLVRGERPGARWIGATTLAILGCGLLIATSGDRGIEPLAFFMALGAGLAYATYAVASKGLLTQHSPDAVQAAIFCLGALLLIPVLLTFDLSWVIQTRGLAVSFHLGLLATALAYLLFARGLRLIPVANAVTLSLAEPLTASLLGLLLLKEPLTMISLAGMALLFAGLLILAIPTQKTSIVDPERQP
jgi:DME family drug/metabolite transporter